LTQLPPDF